jgi:hypothetical protein
MGRRKKEESIIIDAAEQGEENHLRVLTVQIKCSKSFLEVGDFLARQGAYIHIGKFLEDALRQDIQRYVEGGQEVISRALKVPSS